MKEESGQRSEGDNESDCCPRRSSDTELLPDKATMERRLKNRLRRHAILRLTNLPSAMERRLAFSLTPTTL
jgi:hypothetical protein